MKFLQINCNMLCTVPDPVLNIKSQPDCHVNVKPADVTVQFHLLWENVGN